MSKKDLRKQYLAKRLTLSPVAYAELNQKILQHFQQLKLTGISCIHIYLPILSRREPDTFTIVEWLKASHPHIKRVFPKADFSNYSMQHFIDDESLDLITNEFDIPEPVSGNEIDTAEIDIVIVPLLVFDKRGYRVGYGQGFYDRFMAQCKPGTQFIGLSFFEPIDLIPDINQYDLPMHKCITPDGVWEF